jgi:hypothetical protein
MVDYLQTPCMTDFSCEECSTTDWHEPQHPSTILLWQ